MNQQTVYTVCKYDYIHSTVSVIPLDQTNLSIIATMKSRPYLLLLKFQHLFLLADVTMNMIQQRSVSEFLELSNFLIYIKEVLLRNFLGQQFSCIFLNWQPRQIGLQRGVWKACSYVFGHRIQKLGHYVATILKFGQTNIATDLVVTGRMK